jgi:iron complex outermembrane recepter protein
MNSANYRKLLVSLVTCCIPLALTAQTVETSDEILTLEKFEVTEMKSFSDQAIAGKTPVSFSEIGKEVIAAELGSRDIPLVLNSTPSVYATADSGGAGDSRVNVRGFSQRNVSILINGVPTNDIENGWLYWSNWDGLGDVTSTIQMQRGLSNVTLPTPSIGGTMNIITDPASNTRGGSVKTEVGNDGFLKGTVVLNTGLLDDRFAMTIGLVAKTGDGYVRGTWTDGYGYYIGTSFKVNETNRLELFAIGAPQRHGQRTFASNIAAYDTGFAKSLGYTDQQINSTASGANAGALRQGPINAGYNYNQNYAPVSSSYTGQQYYWGSTHSRHDAGFINERENYFNKPQVNLNWYLTLSDQLKVTSVFYYSGGFGGGSGTLNNGSSSAAFARYPNTDPSNYGSNINWDGTIASNAGAVAANGSAKIAGQSLGILRNSVNDQAQYGIVSKATYTVDDSLKLSAGVDWRTAEIEHYREIRDLLGGSYYIPAAGQYSEFDAQGATRRLGLGDKVDYYNINTVDWLGLFLQAQYEKGPITAFGVVGYSYVDYSFKDPFRKDANGGVYTLDPGKKDGNQIKGGLQYAVNDSLSVYANAGLVSKSPIFDGVINDITGALVDTDNEEFKSGEFGVRFTSSDRKFNASASYYYTVWDNRTVTVGNERNNTISYVRGINSTYAGIELEAAYQPNKWVRGDLAASFGDWNYTGDASGTVNDITTGALISSGAVYLKDLKVGDAPQSQVAYAVTVYPTRGLSVKLQGRWYDRYWADYNPETRTDSADRGQAWQIPSYTIYDLHVNYTLPLDSSKFDVSLFGHIFNLTDEVYISDATDNSSFESVGLNLAPSHSAQRAEVFFGLPLSYNVGVKVKF